MKTNSVFLKLVTGFLFIFGIFVILGSLIPEQIDPEKTQTGIDGSGLLLGLILAILGLSGFVIPAFNRLIKGRNQCLMALSNIDILLKRRHDLIDNLVAVAQRYARHESEVFRQITELRGLGAPANMSGKQEELKRRFAPRFLAVAEDYPDLKADRSFSQLFEQLVETEDKIMQGRIEYNAAALAQNNLVGSFPLLLIAFLFRFRSQDYFELNEQNEV